MHRRPATFEPNLYLYDKYPGGVGQSAPLYRLTDALLRQTAELLARLRLRGVDVPPAWARWGRSGNAENTRRSGFWKPCATDRRERPPCLYNQEMPPFDVVGVGLNATDTLLVVPHFPAYAGKVPFQEEVLSPGGQVASAMVACARLGLRSQVHRHRGRRRARAHPDGEPAHGTGINLDHVQLRRGCANQSAYIIIDRTTGERTVLWRRDGLPAHRTRRDHARADHLRAAAAYRRPRYAGGGARRAHRRAHGIPVTVDVDTIYHGFDRVLPNVDYLVASSEFPAQLDRRKRSLQGAGDDPEANTA